METAGGGGVRDVGEGVGDVPAEGGVLRGLGTGLGTGAGISVEPVPWRGTETWHSHLNLSTQTTALCTDPSTHHLDG